MAFNGHFRVMSHIFPQLIQTAAVVVIQILMSDRACDVALRSSVLPCLWDSEHRSTASRTGSLVRSSSSERLDVCHHRNVGPLARQSPALAIAAPSQGERWHFIYHIYKSNKYQNQFEWRFRMLLLFCYRPQEGDQNGISSLFWNSVASPHSSQASQWYQRARSGK